MKPETICIQAGYSPKNGEPRVMPIYQSTTYKYDSAQTLGELFDLKKEGHMYSRISNPSVAFVEEKVAMLEGGIGAMMTSSGQAAILISILNLCSAGDNFVCSSAIYGGTVNLFSVTLKRMGIECRYICLLYTSGSFIFTPCPQSFGQTAFPAIMTPVAAPAGGTGRRKPQLSGYRLSVISSVYIYARPFNVVSEARLAYSAPGIPVETSTPPYKILN